MAFIKLKEKEFGAEHILNTDMISQIYKGNGKYNVVLVTDPKPLVYDEENAKKIFDIIGVSL